MNQTNSNESYLSALSHFSKCNLESPQTSITDKLNNARKSLSKLNVNDEDDELSTLKEFTENLHLINCWLDREVQMNESKYKATKSTFEKELKNLEAHYDEFKCTMACVSTLQQQIGECCHLNASVNPCNRKKFRQQEVTLLEKELHLLEPKLFQKYQAIYKHPRKKDAILDSILSTLNRKRIALGKLAAVVKQKRLVTNLASGVYQPPDLSEKIYSSVTSISNSKLHWSCFH